MTSNAAEAPAEGVTNQMRTRLKDPKAIGFDKARTIAQTDKTEHIREETDGNAMPGNIRPSGRNGEI
jgi:hypothetical protein